jgi:hypothetical protein
MMSHDVASCRIQSRPLESKRVCEYNFSSSEKHRENENDGILRSWKEISLSRMRPPDLLPVGKSLACLVHRMEAAKGVFIARSWTNGLSSAQARPNLPEGIPEAVGRRNRLGSALSRKG